MIRRHHSTRAVRKTFSSAGKRGRKFGGSTGQRYWVERLEERYLLSANTTLGDTQSIFNVAGLGDATPGTIPAGGAASAFFGPTALVTQSPLTLPPHPTQSLANAALLAESPFPLDQTFLLHSNPTATKRIYLDFDGFTTRNTPWNSATLPNIVSPAFSLDDDLNSFNEPERLLIQSVWEKVSEDYRPFDVDVTTQDPGVEALMNTGGGDQNWGIRVVIGGDSTYDWFTPNDGRVVGGVAFLNSFTSSIDTPAFVFGGDFGADAHSLAEVVSHETGHTLGLGHDGLYRSYFDISDEDEANWKWVTVHQEYYSGHVILADGSSPMAPTGWAPIMGVGYYQELTQWSKGEYPGADNIQDDLAIITGSDGNQSNGFTYRADDHGNAINNSNVLGQVSNGGDLAEFSDEGIIEQNTDIDYFSFIVEGLGEVVTLDVTPFHNGPNLDVLAKIRSANGTLIASSNPLDELFAGSQGFGSMTDGGWLLANGTYAGELYLAPGTYYVSVEGGSRPITYIDPVAHPGVTDPPGPNDETVPDESDWGYSNYGSLGYYTITGTKSKGLVVGVDFDGNGGNAPPNWNLYVGGAPTTLSSLISETGAAVPYTLSVSSTNEVIESHVSSAPIDPVYVPQHNPALNKLDGYLTANDETLSFVWGNLAPNAVYQIYVFGHSDTAAENVVTVTGGQWNGQLQSFNYTQTISPHGMVVNDQAPGNDGLTTYAMYVVASEAGEIRINVSSTGEDGSEAAVAGVALATTKVGSITGRKFNDANGNRVRDSGEGLLEGWIVYIDQNNDGILNSTAGQTVQVQSPDSPQDLQDLATIKSELTVEAVGQVLDIDVQLDITHPYDSDLNIWLVSPSGTRVKLVADVGAGFQNFTQTIFDDEATTSINNGIAPFTGRFRPQEPLSTFAGEATAGVWQLEVYDDAPGDTGVLKSWSVTIKLAGSFLEPFDITDASGNYSFTNLPPGQYQIRESFQEEQIAFGWQQTIAPARVTVGSGANITGVDFGNWIPVAQHGSIQGQVFNDVNSNGVKDPGDLGVEGAIVFFDANGNGVRDASGSPIEHFSADTPQPIIDFSTTNSQIVVPGFGSVFSVEVSLNITHSFIGDLDAFLISPSGRIVELFTGVGGQYNNLTNVTLSDSAARSISTLNASDQPYTGIWKPEGLLSDFIGEDSGGTWTLQIRDTDFADQGSLVNWSVKIGTGELFRATDASGNYLFENLPAGAYQIREEAPAGSIQVPPADTSIPAAEWQNSRWLVNVTAVDNPADPDGPDSKRNVKNVNFGNQQVQPLNGDFNRSGQVDLADFIVWRNSMGQGVAVPFLGADGNGDGVVNAADHLVWAANYGRYVDDHSNASAGATAFSTSFGTKAGKIEVGGDVDWFSFDASAGETFDIHTVLGSLGDSALRVIGTDGSTQLAFNDNSTGLASLINWMAPADGKYFVEVSGIGSSTGTYDLSIMQTGVDDHGNTAATATQIAVPSTTAGVIEIPSDEDWFKFAAVSGTQYSFETSLGSLLDSTLELIDKNGTTQLAFDDDSGVGLGSRIDWTAPSAGTYYLVVRGFSGAFGTYNLQASTVAPGSGSLLATVDAPELGAGAAALGGSASETIGTTSALLANNSATVAFDLLDATSPTDSGTGSRIAASASVARSSAQQEAALVAWLQSLATGNMDSAVAGIDSADSSSSEPGDFWSDADAVFDELGASAIKLDCAV